MGLPILVEIFDHRRLLAGHRARDRTGDPIGSSSQNVVDVVYISTGDRPARVAEHRRNGRLRAAQHVRRRREAVPQSVQGDILEAGAPGNAFPRSPQSPVGRSISVANGHYSWVAWPAASNQPLVCPAARQ